jgi:hypothetical protein
VYNVAIQEQAMNEESAATQEVWVGSTLTFDTTTGFPSTQSTQCKNGTENHSP